MDEGGGIFLPSFEIDGSVDVISEIIVQLENVVLAGDPSY
jgi:hypothetical protein